MALVVPQGPVYFGSMCFFNQTYEISNTQFRIYLHAVIMRFAV